MPTVLHFLVGKMADMAIFKSVHTLKKPLFWVDIFFGKRPWGPPRLAAGAGDRNTETLKDFYVLGLLETISERFVFGAEPSGSRAPPDESQAAPWVTF